LRENTIAFERADLILLTRTELNPLIKEIYLKLLQKEYSHKTIYELDEAIIEYTNIYTKEIKYCLSGNTALAFSGIGNPQQFYDSLEKNNVELLHTISFPDHYEYTIKDLALIDLELQKSKASISITTEKDAVKIIELVRTSNSLGEIINKIWIAKLNIKGIKYISGNPINSPWNKLLNL
jgi:tetraacyldisaccharide 4'-kinase